tara:strand:- start:3687 stop:4835 length:1149 start_codon:yes stop_codon:yes gene_type:complete
MAFSLAGFGAGFASKASDRIDENRVRSQKLQDEARTIATQQRLRKQAKRDTEKALAEEMVGTLKMLGYSDDNAAQIASNGKGAGKIAIEAAQKGLAKGVDANTIFNFSSVSGDGSSGDQEIVNSTIEAASPKDMGDLNGTSEAVATKTDTDILSREFGINTDVWKNLYAEPEKIETSYSARLAVISQKLARPTKDVNVDDLKSEQTKLLADLKAMKEAERAEEGTTTPSFTLGTISANVSEIRRGALTKFGFKIGLNDSIENLNDGNQHLADVASMEISYQLNQRNLGIQDPNMANTSAAIRSTALSGLQSYGQGVISDPTKATSVINVPQAADFAAGVENGQYKAGQVVQTTGEGGVPMYVVYTGVEDFKTGMPFIVLSGG